LLYRQWGWLIALFSISQPGIQTMFLFGRPDHHNLINLLEVVIAGLAIRLLINPDRRIWALAAGTVGAMNLWVSLEALPVVVMVIAAFGISWLTGERRHLRMGLDFSAALMAGLVLAVLGERGGDAFLALEFDRLSLVHLVLFGLNLVAWLGLVAVDRRDGLMNVFSARMGWSALAVGGIAAALWLFIPDLFRHPVESLAAVRPTRIAEDHRLWLARPGVQPRRVPPKSPGASAWRCASAVSAQSTPCRW